MTKVAVVGYGNIGKSVLSALKASNDLEIAGVVSSSLAENSLGDIKIVRNITDLKSVDVAILCSPSRLVPDIAEDILSKGICTVDSFDIHSQIVDVRKRLDPVAKKYNASSIIASGWDPSSDSVIRTLMLAMTPKGITYTNFGPGMSMGHTVAVKAVPGVKSALSMTIPTGTGIHRRMVYVELETGADFKTVETSIKNDKYFINDETHVTKVDSVDALTDMGHGVEITRKGVSGSTQSQRLGFTMSIDNPALTGQILVSCARAVTKQQPGCYTLIEIPPINLLAGDVEDLIHALV